MEQKKNIILCVPQTPVDISTSVNFPPSEKLKIELSQGGIVSATLTDSRHPENRLHTVTAVRDGDIKVTQPNNAYAEIYVLPALDHENDIWVIPAGIRGELDQMNFNSQSGNSMVDDPQIRFVFDIAWLENPVQFMVIQCEDDTANIWRSDKHGVRNAVPENVLPRRRLSALDALQIAAKVAPEPVNLR